LGVRIAALRRDPPEAVRENRPKLSTVAAIPSIGSASESKGTDG
jgi:hypothetical protein